MNSRLGASVFCLLLLLCGKSSAATPLASCRQIKARPEAWVTAKTDALIHAARAFYEDDDAEAAYTRVVKEINGTLLRCKLSKDGGFANRYRNFVEYVEAIALNTAPDHELGFNVPDRQYFAETRPFVQIPEFLLTPEFLRAVSRWETLERAKEFLRQLNSKRAPADQLIFFSYTSRHLGTPDNDDSFRRLLIVVPGDASKGVPEKWVQFGVTDPKERERVRNVSIVSTFVAADGTNNTYFKDYYRIYRPDGSIGLKGRWELGFGDDNCAQCHKSGILPIFPEEASVSPSEQWAVEAVNQRFLAYGSPRFDKYLDATSFGPGLGTADRETRLRRFGASFDETKVGRAMTCAACHQPERLGSLNWPMDRATINSFVTGGKMPVGLTLTEQERDELYKRLLDEYFATDKANPGILKSWLLGVSGSDHKSVE